MLVNAGWNNEGISFYVSDKESGVPQYRLYNPNAVSGAHHYTRSIEERDMLVKSGWKEEGIGFYTAK